MKKFDLEDFLSRITNVGTIIGVTSATILILAVNGVKVDSQRIMTTVQILCAIGLSAGILNNASLGKGFKDHLSDLEQYTVKKLNK